MPENVGTLDAVIRGILGLGALVAAAALNHSPAASLALAVLALLLLGTALTKVCPLYTALGISTNRSS